MKKFILAALLPILYFLCILPVPHVSAEGAAYACIRSDDVYLYAEENDRSGLFVLPRTYYVRILSTGIDFCEVEYLSDGPNTRRITGYCKTAELTFVDYTPSRPYLYCTFDVTYRIDDETSAMPGDDFLYGITVTCAYYGDYRVGSKTYCYVLMEDRFGYIPKPDDLKYDLNTEYDEHLSSDTDVGNFGDAETEKMTPAQIALLVLLCILVPVVAALILRPPKRPPYETDE